MIEQEFVIKNTLGLHAKPASEFVKRISRYKSSVKIFKGDEVADGRSILEILVLAVACGDKIKIIIDGEDEHQAMQEIKDLIEHKFYTEQI
ncbi:MAG: HPr family phosphocarrier protein [Endomicrobia bacterium]|nr:HPr family phosphocarrier protein [Endomicrobiia bacterium]